MHARRTNITESTNINKNLPLLSISAAMFVCIGIAVALLFLEQIVSTVVYAGSAAMSWRAQVSLVAGHSIALLLCLGLLGSIHALSKLATRLKQLRKAGLWIPALGWGILLMAPSWFVGATSASGSWISEQSYAPLIPWGTGVAGFLTAFTIAYFSYRWPPKGTNHFGASLVTGGFLVGLVTFGLVDLMFEPNLHRPFHTFVYACQAICGAGFAARMTAHIQMPHSSRKFEFAWLGGGILVSVLSAWLWADMPRSIRSELLLRSTTAGNWIHATASSQPKNHLQGALAAIDHESLARADMATPSKKIGTFGIDDTWNVLFITVDTLRADTLLPVRTDARPHAQSGDTPHLDTWIERSFRFKRAYSQASMTHRSLPPTFRSLEANENPEKLGIALGTAMASLGRLPVAVVNNFFIEPRFRKIQQLLDGFHRIDVYEKTEMSKQIALTRDLIDSIEKQSFFAWVHFYCMHMPGFDDKILSRKDGSWTERYRSSLQWLDQQMGHLLAYLEQRGLADHTLVVFAADHGEGLGDNRVQTHGPTVFDEEVRVPLVIHVPGQPGRYIDATVGNIDIVPTLFELLGAEPNNNHRGQSLVPLLTGEVDDWTESYYIENNNRSQVALVEKDHKLIWDQKADLYHRFNLDIDETEDHSIYGADPQEDNRMLMGLVHKNPSLFLAEIEHEETKKELARAWKVADDPAASSALDLLLFLSAKQPTTGVIEDVVTLFETTDDDTVRFMILRHMFATDREAWSRRIEEHLRPLSSTEAELTFIRGLAANGQDEFSAEFVYDRAHWWVEHGLPEHWEPWLRLISGWKKSSDTQLESTLALMLERSNKPPIPNTQPIPSSVLVQIIHNLAATAPLKLPQVATARIQRILLELLGHRDLPVQIATCYALGKIGDDVAIKHLEDILTNTAASIRLRQTALYSIVRRRRVAAISLIEKYGHEPFLTVDAVNHMRWIRHPDGIPFLKHIATNYYNPLIRKRAKKAIAAIKSAKK